MFPKWYSYLLRNEINKRAIPNPSFVFRTVFEEQYHIKVVQPKQSESGFEMFFRCPTGSIAELIWVNHSQGLLGEVFKSMVWYPELVQDLHVDRMQIVTYIDEVEYRNYLNTFLVFQSK